MVAEWLTGSVFCADPCGTVRVRRSREVKRGGRSYEIHTAKSRLHPLGRSSRVGSRVPGSRTPGGTTGRAASSSPSGSSTGLMSPTLTGTSSRFWRPSTRTAARPNTRFRRGCGPGEPSKPPNRPTRSGPRLRGWPRAAARSRETTASSWACRGARPRRMLPGATADPSRRTSRTPLSSSTASWCSSSTGGCGRGTIPSRSCSPG